MSGPCDDELYNSKFIHDNYTACDFIYDHLSNCTGESILNYRILFFCHLNQNLYLAAPLGAILLAFYFYVIGGTSEQYLTPALAKIAQFFKMSENLAGVTFLAFGNGSADVVSSIVASGLGEDGIYMSSSGLIGSCTVNSFFLAPLVVLLSKKDIKLPSETYGRDVLFLLCTQTVLLGYLIGGTIYWYMGLLFPIMYVTYVSVCFYQEQKMKAGQAAEDEEERRREAQLFEEDLAHSQTKAEAIGEEVVRREGESFVKYSTIDLNSFIESHIEAPETQRVQNRRKVIKVSSGLARSIKNRLWMNAVSVAVKIAESPEEEEEKSIIGKIFHYIIALPCNVIRNLSMPPSSEENWSRVRASVFPLPALAVICLFFELYPETLLGALILVAIAAFCILLSLTIYCTTHMTRAPNNLIVFTFISFLMAIIWIWGLANLLVDLLELVGIVADLPLEFLALTFLGFGNAMPDISTGIALAKMGLSEMALTGCVSEPLFSTLIGLGCSMMRASLSRNGSIQFSIVKHKQAILPLVGICLCLGGLFSFFVYNCRNKFHMKKFPAIIQLFLYAFFFGVIITLTAILPENSGH